MTKDVITLEKHATVQSMEIQWLRLLPRVENGKAGPRVVFHVTRDQNKIVSQRCCGDL